ncbi:hypothetical protein HDV03_003632 [Kappamyces sp. JEL0829]|nr:hypothetical protein HDV03_003632 [Kappamyces sp. JEL0829]
MFAPPLSCSAETVHSVNKGLLPVLNELVQTSVFRYYKVSRGLWLIIQANLHKECPFWAEDLKCSLRDCSVLEAQSDVCRLQETNRQEIPEDMLGVVDYSPPTSAFGMGLIPRKCYEIGEDDFCYMEDLSDQDGIYINLLNNPERYTAYVGESAARVWGSIYNENCFDVSRGFGTFQQAPDVCTEKKVFYSLISGLHSSISLHICGEWYDRQSNEWIRNATCYLDRFNGYPERIDNLYFLWSVLVRAVSKLSPYLQNHSFCAGSRDEEIVVELLDEFKTKFRNISQIMDCVGCEKCRLWGKIQTSGIGTALKVLFSYSDSVDKLSLTRPELVSLINTFHRVCESVELVSIFQLMTRDPSENRVLDPDQFLVHMQPLQFERGGTFFVGALIIVLGAIRLIQKWLESARKYAAQLADDTSETKEKIE